MTFVAMKWTSGLLLIAALLLPHTVSLHHFPMVTSASLFFHKQDIRMPTEKFERPLTQPPPQGEKETQNDVEAQYARDRRLTITP